MGGQFHIAVSTQCAFEMPAVYTNELRLVANLEYPEFSHEWTGKTDETITPFGMALSAVFAILPDPHAPQKVEAFDKAYREEVEQLRFFTPLCLDEMRSQWLEFLQVLARRAPILENTDESNRIANLSQGNVGVWGSNRQYAFGKVVMKLLHQARWTSECLDPIWGILLSPTGGIVGADNRSLIVGDLQNSVVLHAVVHDAFGYTLKKHQAGPGYNYLSSPFTLLPTTSPLSGQIAGILTASYVLWGRQCVMWTVLAAGATVVLAARIRRLPVQC